MASALTLIDQWPVPTAAAAVVTSEGIVDELGPIDHVFRLASLSKPLATWAAMVAVEEGSITLDEALGQPGCTIRHLLAHAGGYPFDGPNPIAAPGRRRNYSNTGIELVADHIAVATSMPFARYLAEAVFEPLGMGTASLRGSAAHQVFASVRDVSLFLSEVLAPRLIDPATAREALTPQFPDLRGVIPGVGTFDPCPWGLGFEIHGRKSPHWMGRHNSADAAGHFGGSGTMMWVEPHHDLALVALTDRMFDDWAAQALEYWPQLSDTVLARHRTEVLR